MEAPGTRLRWLCMEARHFRCERGFTLVESKMFNLNVSANESAGSDHVEISLPNYATDRLNWTNQTNHLLKWRELKELTPGEEWFCPCLTWREWMEGPRGVRCGAQPLKEHGCDLRDAAGRGTPLKAVEAGLLLAAGTFLFCRLMSGGTGCTEVQGGG